MGATKIMVIRHAEKPGNYNNAAYLGINALGQPDADSLVTMGWERAGGIANLFNPTNSVFQNPALAMPDFIYAANPAFVPAPQPNGNLTEDEPSQRPYQTISALYGKMGLPLENLNISFTKNDYPAMVTSALALPGTVLIAWQHQDILPKAPGSDSIAAQLLKQTSTLNLPIPGGAWPGARYDMVFVFDRPSGTGPFTAFTQVPQLLLAGDLDTTFPVFPH